MKRTNMYRIVGGKRIHVNHLAAQSRKFSVSNNTIPKVGLNDKNIVTVWKEMRLSRFDTPIYGKMFEIDKDGHYHVIEVDHSWKEQHHKQPKRLIKCKKRKYSDYKSYSTQHGEKELKREKRNDFVKYFPKFPYTIKPLTKEAYWEKLVAHKLEKWDKKNPKPEQDLFDKVEDWEQRRFIAEQRFRDFVVSVYDPLTLTGRFVIGKGSSATYQEKKVAEIKDINGEGHKVNHLPNDSKLMKKVQKITNHVKDKHPNLVACNLKDHKKQHGRMILPQAA